MGKFKNTLMDILACDLCYGKGWLYVGNNEDFDVYTCDCNLYSVPADSQHACVGSADFGVIVKCNVTAESQPKSFVVWYTLSPDDV